MIQPAREDARFPTSQDEQLNEATGTGGPPATLNGKASGADRAKSEKEDPAARAELYQSLGKIINTASFHALFREMNGTLPDWVRGIRLARSNGLVHLVLFAEEKQSPEDIAQLERNLKQFLNRQPLAIKLMLGDEAHRLGQKMLIAPPGTSLDNLSDDELGKAFQYLGEDHQIAELQPAKQKKNGKRFNSTAFQLEARRTAPPGVKLWKASIYEIADRGRKGSVYFSVFRVYVPDNLRKEAEKWRNTLETKHRVGIILQPEHVSEGITKQLSKIADDDGIVRDAESVKKLISKIHGSPPSFNINLLPHIRYPDDARDMTDRPSISIDPPGAMDLDDLIDGVQLPGGGYRVWVHFADVTHVIKPGDPHDRYAGKVGFSLYGRQQSIPLLGRELGYRYLSLLPGEERLAWTIRLDIDPSGKIEDREFFRSVVKNHYRFTFDELRLSPDGQMLAPATPQMQAILEAASLLRANRLERAGFVKFKEEGSSYMIIEELMLASKSTIASIFDRADIPILYRVHTPTLPKKELLARVRARGIHASRKDFNDPIQFRRLLNEIQSSSDNMSLFHEILDVYLRRARYDVHNRGHHGLGLDAYTEIKALRNYAGLLNQRQAAHLKSDEPPVDEKEMKRWQRILNRKHRTYHDNVVRLITFESAYSRLEQQGKEFKGKIESQTPFGLMVSVPGFQSWGLVPFVSEGPLSPELSEGSTIPIIFEGFEPGLRRYVFRFADPLHHFDPIRCTFSERNLFGVPPGSPG